MTPVLASANTFLSNCIFRVNNSWSQRILFRLTSAVILLSCLPFKVGAAETQARICISVLSGMKSQNLQLSLNEAQQSIVVKDLDSKIKTAYHFAAGRLRVVGEQGPKLAIILVGNKSGKSKFEESQFDIVDRDEVNLRLMLDPNTSFAVHQYLID
ncbi:MAG TPA: hypothetical protein PLU50_12015, partial [Pseudobdellovibrionaceae bacterium]|nr:hypothetical protein [Pseudobdellovibrionaceae bacterium]